MRERILQFIGQLREAGVAISVAESLDAMKAVAAAGIERERMREALAAALVKDEGDRPAFDDLFAKFFRAGPGDRGDSKRGKLAQPGLGEGRGPGPGERPETAHERKPGSPEQPESGTILEPKSSGEKQTDKRAGEAGDRADADRGAPSTAEPAVGAEAGRIGRLRAAERKPFASYSQLDYETARAALAPLARRFRVRLGRRLGPARRGRLDFRRTIRASTQRGGALFDLRFRARRPRHVDLLILADISGSVRYSSTLMLELAAGAQRLFRRVRSFVFIDRLAEADFEDGHLVMTPPLDLYSRSDFGRVLAEVWTRRGELLSRATLVVIMGDGRNNRRPPRADLLREIARIARAVVWLNPEEPERWGTGDSAIRLYAREVTALVPARDLRELEQALAHVA